MKTFLRNLFIYDLDPPGVRQGTLVITNGIIAEIVAAPEIPVPEPDDEVVDCSGKIVLPGLVVGHTHLYSALAIGMPLSKRQPENFAEILEEVWWKLDRALDDEAVYYSALVGAARAALCGSTCLVDHHASPEAIPGSLDRIQEALQLVGIRGVLCYEVTDRNGQRGTEEGLAENDRFLQSCATEHAGFFAGLVGAHASFTLSDKSLQQIAELADQHKTGVHIHVAEDPTDDVFSKLRYNAGVMARLEKSGILGQQTILAHCTHLNPQEIQAVNATGCWLAHNTRSNMNNSVGYAPIKEMNKGKLLLGTDGIDGDLFAESKTAWLKARDARVALPFGQPLNWLVNSARMVSKRLNVSVGKLQPGSVADLVLLDYDQLTPLNPSNVLGHWFFGFTSQHVESLMVGGKWVTQNRQWCNPKIQQELQRASAVAQRVWERFESL